MAKQLLIEYFPFTPNPSQLLESRNNPNAKLIVTGKIQSADTINANKRTYPYQTLKREVDKYIEGPVKENRSTGELDHPETSVVELKNVSHCIRKIWWEGKDAFADIEVLPTPSGNILKALINSGIQIGISSRALGTTKPLNEIDDTVEVEDDLELICWDIVSTPSTPGAYMRPKSTIREGIEHITSFKESKLDTLIRGILCDLQGQCCLNN